MTMSYNDNFDTIDETVPVELGDTKRACPTRFVRRDGC
jgi:hypothetical protein